MARDRDRGAIVFGVFFVVVGFAFLLDRLNVWTIHAKYLLPILLIAFGVAVLLGARRSSRPRP
ncbi:MAG: LiaI-LiaF-like domain-containing protein [Actinomycetota bacterium]